MINIKELRESDKGRKVIYTPAGMGKKEEGRITSWNAHYVFVDYSNGSCGTPTYPRDLEFLTKDK